MVGASACRVALFMGYHERGTHRVVFSFLAFLPATLADAYAAQCGMSEAAAVVRPLEMGFRLPWMVVSSQTQILVHPVRLDDFSGVHLPVWIPDRFELSKRLHEFVAEHFVEELRPRLSIAVFTAQTSSMLNAKIGCFFHEAPPMLDALS